MHVGCAVVALGELSPRHVVDESLDAEGLAKPDLGVLRQRRHGCPIGVGPGLDAVVEARDPDAPLWIPQRMQGPHQDPGRVLDDRRDRRVGVDHRSRRRPARLELDIERALDPQHDLGPAGRPEIAGLAEREVAGQERLVVPHEVADRGAVDLLLPLDQERDRDRALTEHGPQRVDRGEPDEEIALVVGDAAGVEPAIALRRLEGRRDPLVERVHGLDVVVVVDEEPGRRATGPGGPGTRPTTAGASVVGITSAAMPKLLRAIRTSSAVSGRARFSAETLGLRQSSSRAET